MREFKSKCARLLLGAAAAWGVSACSGEARDGVFRGVDFEQSEEALTGGALPAALRFFPFGAGRAYTQVLAPLAERKWDVVFNGPWLNTFHFTWYGAGTLHSVMVKSRSLFGRSKLPVRSMSRREAGRQPL